MKNMTADQMKSMSIYPKLVEAIGENYSSLKVINAIFDNFLKYLGIPEDQLSEKFFEDIDLSCEGGYLILSSKADKEVIFVTPLPNTKLNLVSLLSDNLFAKMG